MNALRRWFPVVIGGLVVALLLIGILAVFPALAQGPGGMWGRGGMMGWNNNGAQPGQGGPGWMMGYTQGFSGTMPFGPGGMMGGRGPGGMMGGFGPRWNQGDETGTPGYGPGCGGQMGGGRMGGGMMWSDNSPFFAVEPLTVAEAEAAINSYLAGLNDDNLALHEIMIFDNHAYAEVVEKDSGIGAMELLVDPATKSVTPEMGPNMMWNLKYGMMAGFGPGQMMGGRFGFNNRPGNTTPAEVSSEMPVSPAEAVEAAQAYLDANFSNSNFTAGEEAEPFYGYYTLHVNQDGQTVGMLSVNGYHQQVFLHTWHGELLEMSEIGH